ncbi:hypothetical protein E8E15_006102 [Penicillium rubens]|uniref:uncharacterized protein n=1 Tax=Penicillium rubens TaxID=1108849 RepID=UPI001DB0D011|nr:uncharacterized protein N7525_008373 [Penicillium rubens]KAF3016060.1 hypothetical protein E8E15_006102 [Penicillium rubens]KAJ5048473.1 dye-decolorizing heme-containing peroxidase [Penicillium rubens]KAJ5830120.1 hypothetical protein N7525_008373 [Penicillium rubens]
MAPNIKNIQGDIWPRLPKKYETFLFFEITDVEQFKHELGVFLKHLTTAETAHRLRGKLYEAKWCGLWSQLVETICTNISFSAAGLEKLGKTDLGDYIFKRGMYHDMVHDGLDRDAEWLGEFKGSRGQIDGVFTLAASSEDTVNNWMADGINPRFSKTVRWLFTQSGAVLNKYDIEHFGWKDGVSQPLIKGLDPENTEKLSPGNIHPGYIIVGEEGDTQSHPDWAKDGSFMVFRRLKQLVPEFTNWAVKNIRPQAELPNEGGLKLGVISTLSSRLVGRWPNGISLEEKPAPSDVLTDKALPEDDGQLSAEDRKLLASNNFDFQDIQHQNKCPFASHIRKVRPRAELMRPDGTLDDTHAMIRRGISFGPVTSNEEKRNGVTTHDRGLLFVSYQSNLHNGFRQVQNEWANKTSFPPGKTRNGGPEPGLDPIIGQWAENDDESNFINMPRFDDPSVTEKWKLERCVIAEGGEYFFAPSISGIKDIIGV